MSRAQTEASYLESLENKVRASNSSSTDAEDISEELNNVETFLASHSTENKRHITDLANELIQASIMEGVVREELRNFLSRNDRVETEVRQ